MSNASIEVNLARLKELEQQFTEAVERAKLEAMKELAYGAGHEINNPLANIATRAQTLLHDETDPEKRRKLAAINAQAFRAHEMIADLMLFARPPQLRPEPMCAVRHREGEAPAEPACATDSTARQKPRPANGGRDRIRITIIDNGPGIPPDIRPKIFDPFFSGREAGRGLGFGLSKAWRIVTLHGGTIDVRETPSGGATFVIMLPFPPNPLSDGNQGYRR